MFCLVICDGGQTLLCCRNHNRVCLNLALTLLQGNAQNSPREVKNFGRRAKRPRYATRYLDF